MEPLEKAALAVAALAHDVGHPGRTNQFFVTCFDPLVLSLTLLLDACGGYLHPLEESELDEPIE